MRTVLFALAVAISGCVASGQATMGVDSTAVVYQDHFHIAGSFLHEGFHFGAKKRDDRLFVVHRYHER